MKKQLEQKYQEMKFEREQSKLSKLEQEKMFLEQIKDCYKKEAEDRIKAKIDNERKILEMEQLEAALVHKL